MRIIKGFIRLIRFELPFSAGICVVMGQLLALGKFTTILQMGLGFLSMFLLSASILVLNDYFDVETDKINAPDRPIPANLVTKSEALSLAVILLSVSLVLGYLISFIALSCLIVLSIIGVLYNWRFKKNGIYGNLMVSFSVGMTFIYGGISVGLLFDKLILFFGVIAAIIDLGEEIAADSMDVKGDLIINSNSLAIKYGKQTAIKISGSIFSSVILLTLIPFLLKWFSTIYLVPITIIDSTIAYSFYKLLKSPNEEGRKYIRWIYLGATFGIIMFIFVRLISGQ